MKCMTTGAKVDHLAGTRLVINESIEDNSRSSSRRHGNHFK